MIDHCVINADACKSRHTFLDLSFQPRSCIWTDWMCESDMPPLRFTTCHKMEEMGKAKNSLETYICRFALHYPISLPSVSSDVNDFRISQTNFHI